MLHFHPVRSLEEACWSICVRKPLRPHPGAAMDPEIYLPTRHLVRVLVEESTWCIDSQGIEVEKGLVVSFLKEDDAKYFLTCHGRKEEPKCEPVWVVPGMIVAFQSADDAAFFVEAGRAVSISEQEFIEIANSIQQQAAAEPDASVADNAPVDPDAEVTQAKPKGKKAAKA